MSFPLTILAPQPGVLAPREEQGLMHVTDWLPTLVEAVGLDPPVGIDGISHWKAFRDGGELSRTEMLYNFKNISGGTPIAALRQGNWKYLSHVNGFDGWNPAPEDTLQEQQKPTKEPHTHQKYFNQLFDLASDPLEEVKHNNLKMNSITVCLQHNLADEEPERAALMAERLMELGGGVVRAAHLGLDHLDLQAVDQPKGDDPAGNPANFGGVWSDGWC